MVATKMDSTKVYIISGILVVIILMIMLAIWYFTKSAYRGSQPVDTISKYQSRHVYLPEQQWLSIAREDIRTNAPPLGQDAVACNRSANTIWDETQHRCVCRKPFTGDRCQYEEHDKNYYFAGLVDADDVITNPGFASSLSVDNLSSSSSVSCTTACNMDPTCSGVIWKSSTALGGTDTNNCILLHDDPVIGRNQSLQGQNNEISHQLYLKEGRRPLLLDRVVLYNQPEIPRRWYLSDYYNDGKVAYKTVYIDSPQEIGFLPSGLINDGYLVGVYSRYPLSVSKAKVIVNGHVKSHDWVVRTPGQALDLPTTWDKIYVVYIRDNQWNPPTLLRNGPLSFGLNGGAPSSDAISVFHYPSSGVVPPNWSTLTSYQADGFAIQRLQLDQPVQINFIPNGQNIIGQPHYTVWSTVPITIKEARDLLATSLREQIRKGEIDHNPGALWYINYPGNRLKLPSSFTSQSLYVVYVREN
jgi:hypothetical protein